MFHPDSVLPLLVVGLLHNHAAGTETEHQVAALCGDSVRTNVLLIGQETNSGRDKGEAPEQAVASSCNSSF
jgi:hypothetical protein